MPPEPWWTGYASSITYHPNGLFQRVAHAHGVTDLQERDPNDMARPLRLRTTGASEDYDTGLYAFDGAGNVTKMGAHRYVYDLLSRVKDARVEVPGEGCGDELVLTGEETGTATHESCGTIKTGSGGYSVTSDGDVTLTAGKQVALGDGFSVASGGRLAAGTDPALDPGGGSTEASQDYTYDPFGNLLTVSTELEGQSPVTRTFSTNSATNRLSQASYDLSGNVTVWPPGPMPPAREHHYDPFNMLWQTKPVSGRGHTFLYGPGDERIWTIDWTRGTDPNLWLETWTLRDLDGTPLRQFRADGGNDSSDNWSFHRDYVWRGGALLAAHTRQGLRHFHLDHLGSPRLITDADGTTQARHLYFPFGQEATDPVQNDEVLKFTGHERDDLDAGGTTADLDYMHARYFSAHLGRFQSPDPVGAAPGWPQSWNRYTYVLGNPVKYTDPRGLYWWLTTDPLNEVPVASFDDATTVTGTNVSLFFSVLGLLSGPGSSTSGGFFAVGGGGEASRSLIRELFCPKSAQGISGDISTINPFTSGGGGSYGLNLQYVPDHGLAVYRLANPNDISSVGLDIGVAFTINQALGSGPWEGQSLTAMGSYLNATFGGFGTPADQPNFGWHGIQVSVTYGLPFGAGATITKYEKVTDLSFLIPWCQ